MHESGWRPESEDIGARGGGGHGGEDVVSIAISSDRAADVAPPSRLNGLDPQVLVVAGGNHELIRRHRERIRERNADEWGPIQVRCGAPGTGESPSAVLAFGRI